MIDFNASQLTWIVVGACSLGGTGYVTINSSMSELDKKIEISNVKVQHIDEKVSALQQQLDRIEAKMDSQGAKKQ
jgi:peptidoglycan hydrolase CwlO-like protein